jgi:hypothetical protein
MWEQGSRAVADTSRTTRPTAARAARSTTVAITSGSSPAPSPATRLKAARGALATWVALAARARRVATAPAAPGPRGHLPTPAENLRRLRDRSLGQKRSLAIGEFALGIEGLEQFRAQGTPASSPRTRRSSLGERACGPETVISMTARPVCQPISGPWRTTPEKPGHARTQAAKSGHRRTRLGTLDAAKPGKGRPTSGRATRPSQATHGNRRQWRTPPFNTRGRQTTQSQDMPGNARTGAHRRITAPHCPAWRRSVR